MVEDIAELAKEHGKANQSKEVTAFIDELKTLQDKHGLELCGTIEVLPHGIFPSVSIRKKKAAEATT